MIIDIEKLAKDAGAYSTDTAKEVYLQNDEYIFIKNSLINFADAYAAKTLEDKEREIIERCADVCYKAYSESGDIADLVLADTIMGLKASND